MSKSDVYDLLKMMEPFAPPLQELALELRSWVWDQYPESNELIYDNYNALALGWSITDKLSHCFCTMALYTGHMHFGFYWGNEIDDPEKKLIGKGQQYRYIVLKSRADFPTRYIKKLVSDSYINSSAKIKPGLKYPQGTTIVKSNTPTKRRGTK